MADRYEDIRVSSRQTLHQINSLKIQLDKCKGLLKGISLPKSTTNSINETIHNLEQAKERVQMEVDSFFEDMRNKINTIDSQNPSDESKQRTLQSIEGIDNDFRNYMSLIDQKLFDWDQLKNFEQENYNNQIKEIQEQIRNMQEFTSQKKQNPSSKFIFPILTLREQALQKVPSVFAQFASLSWPAEQRNKNAPLATITEKMEMYEQAMGILDDDQNILALYQIDEKLGENYKFQNAHLPYSSTTIQIPGGKMYATGGVHLKGKTAEITSDVFEINIKSVPNGTIQQTIEMKIKRVGHGLVFVQNIKGADYLYAIGGRVKGNVATRTVERYNLNEHEWEMRTPMHQARSRPACCAFENGKIYAFFGSDSNENILTSCQWYDISADQWHLFDIPTYVRTMQLTHGGALQINHSQILIYGGFRDTMKMGKQCFEMNSKILIFETKNNSISYATPSLPCPFIPDGSPVIFEGKIFASGFMMQNFENQPKKFMSNGITVSIDLVNNLCQLENIQEFGQRPSGQIDLREPYQRAATEKKLKSPRTDVPSPEPQEHQKKEPPHSPQPTEKPDLKESQIPRSPKNDKEASREMDNSQLNKSGNQVPRQNISGQKR